MDDKKNVLVDRYPLQNLIDLSPNKIENLSYGRYLYGDYSPITPNLNLISLLRDFVSTTENIIQIKQHIMILEELLSELTNLEGGVILRYDDFKKEIEESIKTFNSKNSIKFKNVMSIRQINDDWIKEEIYMDQIKEGKLFYKKYFNENKSLLESQIKEYCNNSFLILQLWLLNSSSPFKLLDKRKSIFDITLISENNKDLYQSTLIYQLIQDKTNSKNLDNIQCSLHINQIGKFKNGKIKLSEIIPDSIFIPVRFKRSIYDKIKSSLRLITDEIINNNEPEYISITNFFVVNIHKELNTISLILSNDPNQINQKIVKIIFDIDWNQLSLESTDKNVTHEKQIFVSYRGNGKEQKEIDIFNEFTKFVDLKLMKKLKTCLDDLVETYSTDDNILKNGQLHSFGSINKEHVMLKKQNNELSHDVDLVIDFLIDMAYFFFPLIKNIKERSPIESELLIRYEENDKSREYVIKTEDLVKQLYSSNEGQKIVSIMGISPSINEQL